jgi:hypothetical protein
VFIGEGVSALCGVNSNLKEPRALICDLLLLSQRAESVRCTVVVVHSTQQTVVVLHQEARSSYDDD